MIATPRKQATMLTSWIVVEGSRNEDSLLARVQPMSEIGDAESTNHQDEGGDDDVGADARYVNGRSARSRHSTQGSQGR
jgi:hypothetical protein